MTSRRDEQNRKSLARFGVRLDLYRSVATDLAALLVVRTDDPEWLDLLPEVEDREAARSRAKVIASRMRGRTG